MPPIAKVVRLSLVEGRRDQLVVALGPVRALAENDPETESWTMHADEADPNRVFIYECYRNRAAAERHDQSPVLKQALASVSSLLAGPPEIILGEVLASAR
jgi:quinol monooxygenase YgiN